MPGAPSKTHLSPSLGLATIPTAMTETSPWSFFRPDFQVPSVSAIDLPSSLKWALVSPTERMSLLVPQKAYQLWETCRSTPLRISRSSMTDASNFPTPGTSSSTVSSRTVYTFLKSSFPSFLQETCRTPGMRGSQYELIPRGVIDAALQLGRG